MCGKSSKMENINRIYTFFAKRIDKCCCLIMFILAAFIALDLAPVDYCCKLVEQIFTYETGVLVSVILVIWTFTATLVIFYLERTENRHYGNRLIKIILHSYSEHKLYKMVRTFMAELLVLILASIADFEITLVISAIIQFATMLFVFLMVCIETSSDHFQQVMAEEYSAVAYADTMSYKDIENAYKDLMVVKMIRNLDYSNRDSVEELEEILRNNSIKKQSGNVRKYISRRITALILESGGKSQGVKTLILELFADENYDLDYIGKLGKNLERAIKQLNREFFIKDKYAISETSENGNVDWNLGDTFDFTLLTYNGFDKEVNEEFLRRVCEILFKKASTYEYFIELA